MAHVVLLGTCDTKLEELLFLRTEILRNESVTVTLIDVGREDVEHDAISIRPRWWTGFDPELSRGESIKAMADCATDAVRELHVRGEIHGIIAAGGSGGTSLASTVMRNALPIGFPKMIVSTIASGDTGPVVGETDITMMYSVVDIAGLNDILRRILSNAGAAIAAMALSYSLSAPSKNSRSKKRVGITMFGVTTPAVDVIRKHLESNYDIECYIFHATGHGGKAMERLIREGRLDAVLDLTTTEICDLLNEGNMSAGPNRLMAATEAGIPNIVSLGATDMTNFGPKSTVPPRFKDRLLYEHNPVVTLMRSSVHDCYSIAHIITSNILEFVKDRSLVEVWLPMGGVSMLSTPGGPFADAEADAALFSTIKLLLNGTGVAVIEDERAINDPGFAKDIAEALVRKMGMERR